MIPAIFIEFMNSRKQLQIKKGVYAQAYSIRKCECSHFFLLLDSLISFGIILPDINFVYNLFITLLFFLCGANLSIHLLPLPLQWLASVLPLTHGLQAMQLLIHGTWNTQVTFLMLQEVLCMVIYAGAAYLMFRILERAAMRKATIDLY